ncbi:anaerobic sulfite reductase subunit AsrA [Clostridium lacusfryxellense]|uniref:anaerobic sulfite reductase subunit AsrA n=1 Tax=Clostridium lacusfryxellense TaxID=205328 RepID=UPI001C0E61C8|nr:anaerobic sulfite reductase subunit AsrA [Clostridium lacusfryxellense]MBU3112630.1 anaerobic sulfite reductase subunit AsrA [Clostridium lacusfryxellense]
MGYYVSSERMDKIINELKKEYKIYAPRRFEKRGWKSNTDLIRYAQINSVAEIVYDVESDFSPKEVFYPISQALLYFTEDKCSESSIEDSKGIIIFARPCDINAIRRLDTIFLKNGNMEDNYYKRLRDKVKIFMMECREGFDNCFCVSMGSNKTDNYSAAVRFENGGLLVNTKGDEFEKYFAGETLKDFTPEFVHDNQKKVKLPKINSIDLLKKACNLGLWESFNTDCISCGSCNTVCGTCSCFDTTDIIYNETSRNGERRRIWSSCMLEDFTTMAGGNKVRKTAGEMMRFKTLHKVYDYNARFGGEEHMCVGCGRCISRCPQEISFADTINSLSEEMEKLSSKEETFREVTK